MGAAEVIAFEEVRASRQWATVRQHLHECFDQWLARLEEPLHASAPTLSAVTATVWHIRHALTGSLTETIIEHGHQGEDALPGPPMARAPFETSLSVCPCTAPR